jgi:undecaprenyl-diphosphatase
MSALARTLDNLLELDQRGLRWIERRRAPTFDRLMRAFSRAGDWQSWTLIGLASLWMGGTPRQLALGIAPRLILTLALCFGIKTISRRPRPSQSMGDFSTLLSNPDPYSFPSSHTACAWAVCASLGLALGWGWPLWVAHALAISYSRIHVGAHYPLDVLIGTILGVSIALL